ncbi:MAG: heavy metal-associated domain-containing protein [Bacteroidota bacterium]|nr:heavy metal-associated domain-containing protein [Bacteroidota bacterium]
MKTKIIIDNLKCSGCVGTIKKGLKSFVEVSEVIVDVENESVEITYTDDLPIEKLKEKLSSMGYPEKGTLEGFDKFTANAKSYVSCAIGKISNDK